MFNVIIPVSFPRQRNALPDYPVLWNEIESPESTVSLSSWSPATFLAIHFWNEGWIIYGLVTQKKKKTSALNYL